ncbi:MAG: glycoside-pentoside-hexuronide (GPH):cation symporter [Candidatus Izemoplasmatales bacterium]|nr:glycoside-pentoside-hexuronide (GPH):cation symporter [Candidatus Izemoplasmatales bacterium]MDY0372836.1 glycoside-pentoside-hexuronide (GPH):cation symporter [Candidatus Izemoplasmatales bacterium]
MEKSALTLEQKLMRRNKWAYSVGGIGRDMIYQLVATFFIVYIQYSGLGLTAAQFTVIGILLVVGRIWDAINDPFMGSIVENTHSKWGKFRPWILIGALLSGVVIIAMFSIRPSGWWYVAFFFIIYLLWEITFTMNDIPYWSLIPALSRNKKDRDVITSMVVVFAGIGAFAGNAIITFTTVGNAVKGYQIIAIVFVLFFVLCSCLTAFGVKEPEEDLSEIKEKATLRKIFRVIKNNDQLQWAALALVFYSIGSGLLTALGYNFLWLEIGYNGLMTTIFIVSFAISNIVVQSFYAKLAKRFTRNQLMLFSFIALAFGYAMMLAIGWVDFLPVNIITACIFGLFVFGGQSIFYMVVIVNMTNTIEYNEFKTGERNEAIVFSLRPFVAKFSSALQGLIVTLVLVLSGIYAMSQNVGALEGELNQFEEMTKTEKIKYINSISLREDNPNKNNVVMALSVENYLALPNDAAKAAYVQILKDQVPTFSLSALDPEELVTLYEALQDPENAVFSYNNNPDDNIADGWNMEINQAADSVFSEIADTRMRVSLRLSITLLPTVLILAAWLLLKKKYIIDEHYYEKINIEINDKKKIGNNQNT